MGESPAGEGVQKCEDTMRNTSLLFFQLSDIVLTRNLHKGNDLTIGVN